MKNVPAAVQIPLEWGFVMSKYILKYSRSAEVRYISHLDFVRFIHRAIRRAGIAMEYSKGFNPHPVMTVAMPLSVGVTSSCEYIKIGFAEDYSERYLLDRLNDSMPPGFKILAVKKDEGYDFRTLDRAEYIVDVESNAVPEIEKILSEKKLLVMKKSKSGIKEADIHPYIYSLEIIGKYEDGVRLKMILAAGNEYNLKPETVLDAMEKYIDFKPEFFLVHREKILAKDKELL